MRNRKNIRSKNVSERDNVVYLEIMMESCISHKSYYSPHTAPNQKRTSPVVAHAGASEAFKQ